MTTPRMRVAARVGVVIYALVTVGCGGSDNGTVTSLPTPTPKPPASSDFSLPLALEMGRLSLQAYQALADFDDGQSFTLPAPYTLVQELFTTEGFEGEGVTTAVPIAFIATSGTNVYVVFRGTKTIAEWILDAQIGQVPYSFVSDGGMTEQGFTRVYDSIHAQIVQTVNAVAQNGTFTQLYITGHSLGAALALLAVPELIDQTPFKQPIMYSFAGPFTGNDRFVELYESLIATSWRVVNTNDVVPKLPTSPVVIVSPPAIFFYESVNTEYPITFGNPVTDPLDIKDIEDDHSLCNYYNTLCAQTTDPATCKAMADGADGCNVAP